MLLTLDTSTTVCSVAVSQGENILGEIVLHPKNTHSEVLIPALGELLRSLNLQIEHMDAFGVVAGPGSFTGLRVGIGTIQGLTFAEGKPVIAVSSLQTLAAQCPCVRYPVFAWLDARKGEVYSGRYQGTSGEPHPQEEETAVSPDRILDQIDGDAFFVGSGALRYRPLIIRSLGGKAHFAPWHLNFPRASAAAMLALEGLRRGEGVSGAHILPRYLRLSEAEINWSKRESDGAIRG